jgi:hypothetical protein
MNCLIDSSSTLPSSLTLRLSEAIPSGIDVSQLYSLTISTPEDSSSGLLSSKDGRISSSILGLKAFLQQSFPKLRNLTLIGIKMDAELLDRCRNLSPKCLIMGGCYLSSPDLSGFNSIEELRLAPTNIAGAYTMPRSLTSLYLMFSMKTAGHYWETLCVFPTLINATSCLLLKEV